MGSLTIGAFARAARLSPKALRLYDELGLLRPARVDPDSGYANPHITTIDCRLVLFCAQGFSSSFAAASLRELGCSRATDVVGGYEAWKAAGLPVRSLDEEHRPDGSELPGMGGPEPFEAETRDSQSQS